MQDPRVLCARRARVHAVSAALLLRLVAEIFSRRGMLLRQAGSGRELCGKTACAALPALSLAAHSLVAPWGPGDGNNAYKTLDPR